MNFRQIINEIQEATPPAGVAAKIIAIDGGGGAGKSTLAVRLIEALEGAVVVHVDDFIPGPNNNNTWWLRLRDEVVVPLAKGIASRYRRFDWPTRRLAEWHEISPGATVILEGFASLRPEFRPYITYGIWIETPADTRLARGLARGHEDLVQWRQWQISDQAYYTDTRPDIIANVIIDGTKEY